jgi:hypothetical protein
VPWKIKYIDQELGELGKHCTCESPYMPASPTFHDQPTIYRSSPVSTPRNCIKTMTRFPFVIYLSSLEKTGFSSGTGWQCVMASLYSHHIILLTARERA